MGFQRTFACDICDKEEKEVVYGSGLKGWGQLMGIALDRAQNPMLCPDCLLAVADMLDNKRKLINKVTPIIERGH